MTALKCLIAITERSFNGEKLKNILSGTGTESQVNFGSTQNSQAMA